MIINLAQRLLAKQRIESGYYEQPHVYDRVVERVLADLELDDSDDQTRMAEDAEGWTQ